MAKVLIVSEDWCPHCQNTKENLDSILESRRKGVEFIYPKSLKSALRTYGVRPAEVSEIDEAANGLPALVVIKDGHLAQDVILGEQTRKELLNLIDRHAD